MSNVTERIIEAMPMERPFRAIDIADDIYPNLVRYDSEGRQFNRGVATVARLLRKIRGVQEKPYGVFYANIEYFTKELSMSRVIRFSDECWDCECEHNYIKPNALCGCLICGARRNDQPP